MINSIHFKWKNSDLHVRYVTIGKQVYPQEQSF